MTASEPLHPIAPAWRCVPDGAFAGLIVVVMAARATEAVMAAATSTATPIEIRRIFDPFSKFFSSRESSASDPRTSPLDAAVVGQGAAAVSQLL